MSVYSLSIIIYRTRGRLNTLQEEPENGESEQIGMDLTMRGVEEEAGLGNYLGPPLLHPASWNISFDLSSFDLSSFDLSSFDLSSFN